MKRRKVGGKKERWRKERREKEERRKEREKKDVKQKRKTLMDAERWPFVLMRFTILIVKKGTVWELGR